MLISAELSRFRQIILEHNQIRLNYDLPGAFSRGKKVFPNIMLLKYDLPVAKKNRKPKLNILVTGVFTRNQ